MSNEKIGITSVLRADTDAVAAGSDAKVEVDASPFPATVTSVTYTSDAAITGANTNTRTFNLVNVGQAGLGTTVVATLALVSGVNTVEGDEKAITLSATPANLVLAAGDVLEWQSTHAASGLADPGGKVRVTVSRNDS